MVRLAKSVCLAAALAVTAAICGCTPEGEQVVATVDNYKIYKWEVYSLYNTNKDNIEQMQGIDLDDPKNYLDKRKVLYNYLDQAIYNKILYIKSLEAGNTLSAEDEARVQAELDEVVERNITMFMQNNFPDNPDARRLAAEMYQTHLRDNMLTLDRVKQSMLEGVVADKLIAELVKDIGISDEEIKTIYDEQVAKQKQSYADNPAKFIDDITGSDIIAFYAPFDCIRVRHILVGFPEELAANIAEKRQQQGELVAENMGGEAETSEGFQKAFELEDQINQLLEQGLDQAKPKAEELMGRLGGGEKFDALISLYNTDAFMDHMTNRARGYIIYEGTEDIATEVKKAALELQNAGNYSQLIATDGGWLVLELMEKIPQGNIDYARLSQVIRNQITYPEKQSMAYTYAKDKLQNMKVKRNLELLR